MLGESTRRKPKKRGAETNETVRDKNAERNQGRRLEIHTTNRGQCRRDEETREEPVTWDRSDEGRDHGE